MLRRKSAAEEMKCVFCDDEMSMFRENVEEEERHHVIERNRLWNQRRNEENGREGIEKATECRRRGEASALSKWRGGVRETHRRRRIITMIIDNLPHVS